VRRGHGRLVAAALVAIALAGAAYYVQPWGRTMDLETLRASVRAGSVVRMWSDDGGLGGYLSIGPLASPFFVRVSQADLPEVVRELRAAGVYVDVGWEARRLRALAQEAQARLRYYGLEGGDVRSYALRLAEIQPDSREAASLLFKVGERLAWDAEVALAEGPSGRAAELVRQCLELVPDHPRCRSVPLGS
jgi:hypothetical protein